MDDKTILKQKAIDNELTQKLLPQQYPIKFLKPIKLQELKTKNNSALLDNNSTNDEIKLPSIPSKNSLRILTTTNEINTELKTIKEQNPSSIVHSRNLDIIKRLSEKTKKLKEERRLKLSQHVKTAVERLNSLKKYANNNINTIPFEHRRLELIVNEENKIISDDTFYYYEIIHGGNNSEIIEKCLKKRGQWKLYDRSNDNYIYSSNNNNNNNNVSLTEGNNNHFNYYCYLGSENNPLPNLLWSHSSSRIDFNEFSKYRPGHIKKVTNHFEFHREISNKLFLFINMMIFCEANNLDIFSFFPLTFPLKYDSKDYFNLMIAFTHIFNNINKFISDDVLDYKYRNLFDFDLKSRVGYKTSLHIPHTHYEGRNLWLIKAIDLNRGRCIKISDNINGIINIIQHFYKGIKKNFQKNESIDEKIITYNKKELLLPAIQNNNKTPNKKMKAASLEKEEINSNNIFSSKNKKNKKNNIRVFKEKPKKEQKPKVTYYSINQLKEEKTYQSGIVIIQKYIEKPLCYFGRKCDMRLWVLLTWDFNVYLFKEGHFKASSVLYDLNSQNSYVHLTNYSVQKYNENFQSFETGNEISFKNFELSLNNEISIKKDLFPKIKEIILYTMKSVKNKINKTERKICFEIFGYDFIFDVNYKPYLLEVNTNPGLEISSPLIAMLIPRLIDDAFKLTIDKIFPLSKKNLENMKKNVFKVDGYDDNENMFEFLGNALNEENCNKKNSEEM